MNAFCNCRGIHSGMMISLILIQHAFDTVLRKTQINFEIISDIPGAVLFFVISGTNSAFKMLYVRNSGQNDRMKGIYSPGITVYITVAKLGQKIQKNLIICRGINLVDDQN